MILVNAAKCMYCYEIVESKWRHDFNTCRCGNLSVDGGLDYIRRAFFDREWIEMSVEKDGD